MSAGTGCTVVGVIVAGFGFYAASVLGVRIATITCSVARHPAWWARYARTRRHPAPGPGRDDGEMLTFEETRILGNLAAGRDVRTRT